MDVCDYSMHKLTCSHKLLEVAARQGGVFRTHQVQIVPVSQLYVGAELDGVLLLLIGKVDQKSAA